MDARPPAHTLSFNDRMRDMRSIVRTIRSTIYHPIQDENLLALVEQIKREISARLLECYGDEMNFVQVQPKTSMFLCFTFLKPNQDRHANKIKMAELLHGICQSEFKSLLQINYFVRLLTEMKKSDEFIDPNHHRFHGIITSHQINVLMRQVNALVQSLNLSSNQSTSGLYKTIFYLKIIRNEPNFHEREDPISQVLHGHDIRALLGEKEEKFIPLAYEGREQLDKLYQNLHLARKKRLTQTLEYTLIDGYKKKDLIHIVKYIAVMEVIYCFMDGLEIEQKKCAFSIVAHLNKDNRLDAAVSNAQKKLDFCWQVIKEGGKSHLSLEELCTKLDGFKDAIRIETPVDPGKAIDDFISAVEYEINQHANLVYLAPVNPDEGSDVDAHLNLRDMKERCNPHLKHHPEQMLFHQEWQKKIMTLSGNLLVKMRSVANLVDEFFFPERDRDGNLKMRDLDQLLLDVLNIIEKNQVMDATPSVIRKLNLNR